MMVVAGFLPVSRPLAVSVGFDGIQRRVTGFADEGEHYGPGFTWLKARVGGMVPMEGVEPTHSHEYQILSLNKYAIYNVNIIIAIFLLDFITAFYEISADSRTHETGKANP
jgi:hypothetical protein